MTEHAPSPLLAPGMLVGGRYRLRRMLGKGGMGAVFEAEHEALGRRVALKTLLPRYGDDARAFARFAREARAAGSIGHENIVEAIDFGLEHGAPYLVMELLEGETVAEALAREGRFECARACRIAGEILAALGAAHAAGIVHRDLKPANVVLVAGPSASSSGSSSAEGAREAARFERVKVLDFGVSKMLDAHGYDPARTEEGAPIGTPAYMAPEQWLALPDVDARADLFSVGALLFEMLTGGLPYEGATREELFLDVVRGSEAPDRPSALCDTVPAALDAVVLRAVHRDRAQRFADAAEFLEALRPFGATAALAPTRRTARTDEATQRGARAAAATEGDEPLRSDARTTKKRSARLGAGALALVAAAATAAVLGARRGHTQTARAASGIESVAPSPRVVRVTVLGLASDASLRLDDRAVTGPTLDVAADRAAHTLWISSRTGARTAWNFIADRDQTLALGPSPGEQPAEVRAEGPTAPPTEAPTESPRVRDPRARPLAGLRSSERGPAPTHRRWNGALAPAREF